MFYYLIRANRYTPFTTLRECRFIWINYINTVHDGDIVCLAWNPFNILCTN